jgi:hypothetical protein
VALVVVTLSFTAGRLTVSCRALPTIAATLTGTETGFSAEIDERIRKLFPIGSEEARLVDYLVAEGFAPEWQRTGDTKGRAVHPAGPPLRQDRARCLARGRQGDADGNQR